MRSSKLLAPALVVASLMIFACQAIASRAFRVVRGSGKIASQDRPVSGFDRVVLSGIGELTIVQGDEDSLVVEADDNLFQYLETEVRDGTLYLGSKDNVELLPSQPIQYKLALKQIVALTTSGAGRAFAESLKSDQLDIELSGAGNIDLQALEAGRLTMNLSGAGRMSIGSLDGQELEVLMSGAGNCQVGGGQVESQSIDLSGTGSYSAPDMYSKVAEVQASGVGKILLWVSDTLDVDISGTSTVEYYGTPTVTQQVSGIGGVKGLGDKSP